MLITFDVRQTGWNGNEDLVHLRMSGRLARPPACLSSQYRSCRCSVAGTPDIFQRQAHYLVIARWYFPKIKPLENHDLAFKKGNVRRKILRPEFLHRKIIDAHKLNAGLSQDPGCVRRDIREVGPKPGPRIIPERRVARLEKNSFGSADVS